MHYYDKEVVCALLDMGGCIRLMRDVLIDYSAGRTIQTLRSVLPVSERKLLGLMPAANTAAGIMGVKAITVFPDNFQRGLPSHQGVVLLFDLDTGMLKALLDGVFTPGEAVPSGGDGLLRKFAHFAEFGALGLLLGWLFGMLGKKRLPAFALGVAAACIDETIQIFVPGRSPGIRDVCIDSCGAAAGMLLLFLGHAYWKRRFTRNNFRRK